MDHHRNQAGQRSPRPARARRAVGTLAVAVLCGALAGCAALTNPVADGIPVRMVPPELLGTPRAGEQLTPLNLLKRPPEAAYRLGPGDTLGVWVEGLVGPPNQYPPINFPQRMLPPERAELPPSLGLPFPVRDDGTVLLPLLTPVRVEGLTIAEAEDAIRRAYTDQQILKPKAPVERRIIVQLSRPRRVRVLVFRHDILLNSFNANLNNNYVVTDVGVIGGGTQWVGGSNTGTGYTVDLPADDNDLLTALARTGGYPGTNTARDVLIFRHFVGGGMDPAAVGRQLAAAGPGAAPPWGGPIIRIPLRLRPGEVPTFRPEDVILHPGDLVYVEARPVCTFYTGGLLPPGEYILPREYDLDVVRAIARVRGPLVNGAFAQSNLSGNMLNHGIGNPNPSLLVVLRETPDGSQIPIRINLNRALRDPRERILVQPRDMLILQETPEQAIARYFTQVFDFSLISNVIRTSRTTGTINTAVP